MGFRVSQRCRSLEGFEFRGGLGFGFEVRALVEGCKVLGTRALRLL